MARFGAVAPLAQVEPLPRAEGELAALHGHVQGDSDEGAARDGVEDVGARDDPVERVLEVGPHVRIGVLVDGERRGGGPEEEVEDSRLARGDLRHVLAQCVGPDEDPAPLRVQRQDPLRPPVAPRGRGRRRGIGRAVDVADVLAMSRRGGVGLRARGLDASREAGAMRRDPSVRDERAAHDIKPRCGPTWGSPARFTQQYTSTLSRRFEPQCWRRA